MSEFKNRLKMLRMETNRTQQELAESLSISKQAISNYESGFREPSFDVLAEIASHFNVSVDYLVGVSENRSHGLNLVNNQLQKLNSILEQYSGVEIIEQSVTNILNIFLRLVLRHIPNSPLILKVYTDILDLINQHDLFLAEAHSSPLVDNDGNSPQQPLLNNDDAEKYITAIETALKPNFDINKKELDTSHKIAEKLLLANNTYLIGRIHKALIQPEGD